MIDFKCPKCGGQMSAPSSSAGQTETCPSCENVSVVPAPMAEPLLPGAHPPPLDAIRKTPGWAIAVGVISTVFASSNIIFVLISHCSTGQSLLSTSRYEYEYEQTSPDPVALPILKAIRNMLSIGVTGLLLLAGVSLLRRSPLAASLHKIWAWIMVLGVIVVLVSGMVTGRFSTLEAAAGLVVFVPVVLAYPVFLLIWFSRTKVRRQVLAWRLARAT